MQVTLMGPGDLGHWFLADTQGNSFALVTRHEDHPKGASLLGWESPQAFIHQEAVIQDALDWLVVHTGEDFQAPPHVAAFFRQLNEDDEE